MAPSIWDPYRVLNITTRDSYMMHCVGHVAKHRGSRCRWDIPPGNFNQIRSILGEMETKPPNDAYNMLPRLAWLGLCEQYHQNQSGRVVLEWSQAIDDAVRVYENSEDLKRRNEDLVGMVDDLRLQLEVCQASSQIALERQSSEEYQNDAEANGAEQSEVIRDLHSELAEERRVSTQRKKDLDKAKVERDTLDTQARILQLQLANERKASEVLKRNLDVATSRNDSLIQIEDLQTQLSNERQTVEKLKNNLDNSETNRTALSEEVENSRQQLTTERQHSEQLSKTLSEADKRRAVLSEELEEARSKLRTDHQNIEQLKAELEGAGTGQSLLSEELQSLRSKLETDRQHSESLQKACDELATGQEVLIKEMDDLRAKLETERQNTEHLSRELSTSNAHAAIITAQLEEKNAAVAENARLLERISQLESDSIHNSSGAFRDRIKRLAKGAVSCFSHRERDLDQDLPG